MLTTKIMRLENSPPPPPPHNVFNGPSQAVLHGLPLVVIKLVPEAYLTFGDICPLHEY